MGAIWDWLTGRSEKEHDVYANFDVVKQVITDLEGIASKTVDASQTAFNESISKLNSVNGLNEYVGTVDASAYDSLFDELSKNILSISETLESNANDIKDYEEAAWYEKLGSSFVMFSAKATEGLLSIVEDLGDGLVSIGGWAAGNVVGWFDEDAGKSIKEGTEDIVKKEWSHDAFNFYYNSDFAKKSAFTEDSGFSTITKIGSKTVGYIFLTAATAGTVTAAAGVSAGTAAAGHISTAVNVGMAALSGLGSGTESGLNEGKHLDEAFLQNGVSQAVVQGAVAYGGQKLGQYASKKAALKDAKANMESASQELEGAKNALSMAEADLENGVSTLSTGEYDAAAQAVTAAEGKYNAAKEVFESVDASRLTNYLGSSDPISRAGYKVGNKLGTGLRTKVSSAVSNIKNVGESVSENGLKQTIQDSIDSSKAAKEATKAAKATAKAEKAAAKEAAKAAKPSLAERAKDTFTSVKDKASSIKDITVNTVKHPVTTATATAVAGAQKVGAALTSTGAPAVIADAAINTGDELLQRHGQTVKAENAFQQQTQDTIDYNSSKAPKSYEKVVGEINPSINPGENQVTPPVDDDNDKKDSTHNSGSTGSNTSQTQFKNNTGTGGNSGYSGGGGSGTGSGSNDSTTGGGPYSGNYSSGTDGITTPSTTTPSTTTPSSTTTTEQPTTTDHKITDSASTSTSTPTVTSTPSTSSGSSYSGGSTQHTGGGYSGGGYVSDTGLAQEESDNLIPLEDALTADNTASIEDIVKGSKYTKIPTSSKPISVTSKSSGNGSSSVIPIAAGLSAAAAAGIGAKAYMDRKRNNDFDDEDDEFDTEEWSGDENSLDINYDDSSDTESYLDEEDDYSYQDQSEEKYGARSNEELADLQ